MHDQSHPVNHSWWTRYPVKQDWAAIGAILLLATFLRFYGLNEPGLWLDEVSYTIAAQKPIVHQIIYPLDTLGGYLSVDPTLSAIPFSLSLKVGFSNFLARFPAALLGVLGVALIYRVGRALFGNRVGLTVALLLSASSFHILYSQEARSYAQFVFFSLGSTLFFYQAFTRRKLIDWLLYTVFTWAGVSTNHLMLFVIATQSIWLGLICLRDIFFSANRLDARRPCFRIVGIFLLALAVVFLLRLPWLQDFSQRQCFGCDIGHPSTRLDLIGPFIWTFQEFTSPFLPISLGVGLLGLVGLILALVKYPFGGLLIGVWLILSYMLTTVGLWFISQFFHPRYTIWGLPALLLAVAFGALYLGVEPHVRRHWPDSLISWSRLQAGRFRDPLVCSHVLAGIGAGLAAEAVFGLQGAVAGGFVRKAHFDRLIVAASPADLLDRFASFQPETTEKWVPSNVI